MAIDRTGISSLETGAPDITYTGDEGPKSPQETQQKMAEFKLQEYMEEFERVFPEMKELRGTQEYMDNLQDYFQGLASKQNEGIGNLAMADPLLEEQYQQYVFEMQEQGLEPMSFEQFKQQAVAGMAMGGRVGLRRGGNPHSRGRGRQSSGMSFSGATNVGGKSSTGGGSPHSGGGGGGGWSPGAGRSKTGYLTTPPSSGGGGGGGGGGSPTTAVTTGGRSPFPYTRPTTIDTNKIRNIIRKNRYETEDDENEELFSMANMGITTPSIANMGITTPGITDTNKLYAKAYSTQDMEKLLGITDVGTAKKYIEDPFTSSPRFIPEKSWKDPLTQPQAMEKFYENLKEQIEKHPKKDFEHQRNAAFLGIRPEERSFVPADFLTAPKDVKNQKDFSDIAVEIEKKYPMAQGGIARLGYASGQRVGFKGGGADAGTRSFAESLGGKSYADKVGSTYGFSGGDGGGDRHQTASEVRAEISNRTEEEKRRIREEDQKRKELIESRKQQQDSFFDKVRKKNIKNFVNRSIYKDLYRANIDLFDTFDDDDTSKLFPSLARGGLEAFKTYNPPDEVDKLDIDSIRELYASGQINPDDMTKFQRGALEDVRTGLEKKKQLKETGYGDEELFKKLYPVPTPSGDGPPPIIYPYPGQGGGGGGGTDTPVDPVTGFPVDPIRFSDGMSPVHDFTGIYGQREIPMAADGGRIGYAGGGDVRQGYFLGKLVKKAGRALKKVAKSPLGKAALMYGLGSIGGSYGLTGKLFSKGMLNPSTMMRGLIGAKGAAGTPGIGSVQGLLGKFGLTKGFGGMMPTALGGIAGLSALGGLYTAYTNKEDEEDDLMKQWLAKKQYYDNYFAPVGNPDNFQRMRLYADGGRTGYDDGGSASDRFEAKIKELMDKGLSRELAEALVLSELSPDAYSILDKKDGGRIGYRYGKNYKSNQGSNEMKFNMDAKIKYLKEMGASDEEIFEIIVKGKDMSDYYKTPDRFDFEKEKFAYEKERDIEDRNLQRYLGEFEGERRAEPFYPDRFEGERRAEPFYPDRFEGRLEPMAQGGRIGYKKGGDHTDRQRALNMLSGIRSNAQEGGLMDLGGMEKDYRNDGGFVPIGGQERADDVPARLSKNEFVFTADAVRNAGGGDIDAGAEVMENLMENLEKGGKVSEDSQGLEGARDMFATSQRLEGVL